MNARKIHRVLGLWSGALLLMLGLTGAMLAFFPVKDAWVAPSYDQQASVAGLVQRAQSDIPGLEALRRQPAGAVLAYSFDAAGSHAQQLDPTTGNVLGAYQASSTERWLRNLHRSLLLGDAGRLVTAFAAFALLVLSVSGSVLLVRQLGGWRQVLGRVRGTGVHRLHTWTGRVLVVGLLLSSATALWMSATSFGLFSVDAPPLPEVQSARVDESDLPAARIPFLQALPVGQLRSLELPEPGVPEDVWTVRTSEGEGAIDRKTGVMLAWSAYGVPQRLNDWIYTLHTGKGGWGWAMVLALLGLSMPMFWISGMLVRAQHRSLIPTISANTAVSQADMLIFVASETGSTWGFAQALHNALVQRGHKVHTAPLAAFDVPPFARHVFVFAATYGDGQAPAPAAHALNKIRALPAGQASVTVLGFGDRQFPRFCAYARAIEESLRTRGWRGLLPFEAIHQQNVQAFERWVRAVSDALVEPLVLKMLARVPATHPLTVLERTDYSDEATGAVVILRLGWPKVHLTDWLRGRGMPAFQAGDLLGVVSETVQVPRYYSLASGRPDGFVEICVRKVPGGQCSEYLHTLQPGDCLQAFVKQNPGFTLAAEARPVILIGAGTGIAPLAGFIRSNSQHAPMFLYFGGRDPEKDFLFGSALQRWLGKGHLTGLKTAFSRVGNGSYVQDALRRDAARLQDLVSQGAVLRVCGSRLMAQGVRDALDDILKPLGLCVDNLRVGARYAEDVF
ncbi:PepSY domain-containing protein [Castellaniella sp.]|uniref:PepSY domain-containing protein n=1 Tax=Castellaniella sp. TaxID=1955812 RepID=UPI003C790F82